MPFPRVIPHSDGSGHIDAVGDDVSTQRVGQRVWVYNAQSYRAFGTAAESTVVPSDLAVDMPAAISDELGACLGIPGITAHRAVFADGPVSGAVVLVHGVLGAVSSMAAQLARGGGATVIGTVRKSSDLPSVGDGTVDHLVALDTADPIADIRDISGGGVDRIIEVALGANVELDDAVVTNGAVIAAYASDQGVPRIPFWTLLFNNVVLRLLGDDFPVKAKVDAARELTTAAATGALTIRIADPYPLERVADAHNAVDQGVGGGRVLIRATGS
jgi:NADPH:quinone reductase